MKLRGWPGCLSHGHLKRPILQYVLLRSSRDFASEEKYDRFLVGMLEAAISKTQEAAWQNGNLLMVLEAG